jgi:hypothetical protein
MNRRTIIIAGLLFLGLLIYWLAAAGWFFARCDWRKIAFPAREYSDNASLSFVVNKPFSEVRRRVSKEDLTAKIIQQSGGQIVVDKSDGFKIIGPLRDWQANVSRKIVVKVQTEHYGEMIIPLRQIVVVEKSRIRSEISLSAPVGALQQYTSTTTFSDIQSGTKVCSETHIAIVEHVPESYKDYIRQKLSEVVNGSVSEFKQCFLQVAGQ